MRETHKNKLLHFAFLKSLNIVLLISLILSILLTGITVLVFNAQGKFNNSQDQMIAVITVINVFVVSLPLVLFILCVITSAIFSNRLSKKNIAVNKMQNFELLLNTKVICLEKDNVLVDGSLVVKKVIPLKTVATEQYIDQWVSNTLRAINDKNPIFDALNKQFDLELTAGINNVLHFNEDIKYCGATFKGGKTIVIGSPESVPIQNKIGILKRCEEDINKGCQILVVAEGKTQISDDGYRGELEGIALIVLKDHICEDAFETFKWFEDNNIDIKVISSDNALISSTVAAEAGIKNADKYISLKDMEIENADSLFSQYTVFGDVSSEQKELLINALKKEEKAIMFGGSKEDVLSMKASDFAVATINADVESQKAADVVLETNSLNLLRSVIEDSKSYMNNMQKILSMALVKTVLAFVLILLFVNFNSGLRQCLFVLNHLLLWDLIINGIAASLFIFDDKNKKASPSFFKRAFKVAIPMMILQVVGVITIFVLYVLQKNLVLSTGLYSFNEVAVACVLLFNIFGIASLYNTCIPLNHFRRLTLIIGASVNVLAIAAIILFAYLNNISPYSIMNGPTYFATAIIAVSYTAIYLFINRFIGILKGDDIENEN